MYGPYALQQFQLEYFSFLSLYPIWCLSLSYIAYIYHVSAQHHILDIVRLKTSTYLCQWHYINNKIRLRAKDRHITSLVQYCGNANQFILRKLSFKVWKTLWNQILHPRVQIFVIVSIKIKQSFSVPFNINRKKLIHVLWPFFGGATMRKTDNLTHAIRNSEQGYNVFDTGNSLCDFLKISPLLSWKTSILIMCYYSFVHC